MNILKQELKRSFRSWFYFTISLAAVLLIFISFFNMFQSDAKLLDEMLKNFPQEFKAAFGFADVNLSEIEGYFSFLIGYIVLIGAVFGMKQGLSLLSEEARVHASDFLLAKPIRRSQIVTGKLVAILINLITQNLIVFGVGIVAVHLIVDEQLDIVIYALLCFSTFFVQLFFVGLGFSIAAVAQKIKSVMPITLGVVFCFFIIDLINQSIHEKKLTYLTPFSYFEGSGLIANRSYDWTYLLIDLVVFVVFTAIGYWVYQKKDIFAR